MKQSTQARNNIRNLGNNSRNATRNPPHRAQRISKESDGEKVAIRNDNNNF